jgi:hypothetical protein
MSTSTKEIFDYSFPIEDGEKYNVRDVNSMISYGDITHDNMDFIIDHINLFDDNAIKRINKHVNEFTGDANNFTDKMEEFRKNPLPFRRHMNSLEYKGTILEFRDKLNNRREKELPLRRHRDFPSRNRGIPSEYNTSSSVLKPDQIRSMIENMNINDNHTYHDILQRIDIEDGDEILNIALEIRGEWMANDTFKGSPGGETARSFGISPYTRVGTKFNDQRIVPLSNFISDLKGMIASHKKNESYVPFYTSKFMPEIPSISNTRSRKTRRSQSRSQSRDRKPSHSRSRSQSRDRKPSHSRSRGGTRKQNRKR